ncbi:sugar ABC transporter permease [Candidatus Flexifilum breve]|uniref:carbohydrate ABC transporter permease n=1 Tax=Candidatus Flexifilum breve TaxID=3140694 RepID=UPI0031CC3FD7
MATRIQAAPASAQSGWKWWTNMSLRRRRTITGYIFIMPFILGVLFWVVIPVLVNLYLTFHSWNLMSAPRFVGMQNLETLFRDPILPQALKATFLYTVLSVPLGLLFGFFLANLINTNIRGISIFRTIFYMPSIVPAVANALLWAWMFNTEFGLINAVIRAFGGAKIAWLQDPNLAVPAFVILSLWGSGSSMIIFLAGLQGIPDVYYEAAEIDGAGRWAKMRHITIPMISPVFFFNLVIGFINSLQVFVIGYLVTDGGPQNATLFLVLYIYRSAFQSLKMGYAAALSWVLFGILLVLSVVIFRYLGRRVYYENPGE